MSTLRLQSLFLGLVISAGVLPLVACSGEEAPTELAPAPPPPPPPPPPPMVASVTVAPTTADLLVGSTVQLTATPRDAEGNELTGHVVTWASSAPGVASVSPTGLVSGVSACLATITARSEGQQGAASITVSAAAGSSAAKGGRVQSCGLATAGAVAPLYSTTSDANQTHTFVAQLIGNPDIIGDPRLLQGVLGEVVLKLTLGLVEPPEPDYGATATGKLTRRSGLSVVEGAIGNPDIAPILRITADPFGPRDALFIELGGSGFVSADVAARLFEDPDEFTAVLRDAAGQVVASGNFARAPERKTLPSGS